MVKIKDVMISAMRSVPQGGGRGDGEARCQCAVERPSSAQMSPRFDTRVPCARFACVCPGVGSWMCETHIQFGLQSVHTSTLIYIAEWSQDTIMVHRRDAEG